MKLFNDFNTSVEKAFDEIDAEWRTLEGIVICGSHTPVNWEWQLAMLKIAREKNVPVLGICFGLQLMAIEFARNVLGIEDAVSEEFGVPGTIVVTKREKLKVGLHEGQSYWNNYEVREDIRAEFEAHCDKHNMANPNQFYRGVQYHPEYQSSKDNPHPLLVDFLRVCRQS